MITVRDYSNSDNQHANNIKISNTIRKYTIAKINITIASYVTT